MMITKNEIDVQIALGTADTPQQIAKLVKKTTDADALCWAIKHKNTKVRIAAITNIALPIGMLLYACVFESSSTTREALVKMINIRLKELEAVLRVIQDYPQLSMDWNNGFTS